MDSIRIVGSGVVLVSLLTACAVGGPPQTTTVPPTAVVPTTSCTTTSSVPTTSTTTPVASTTTPAPTTTATGHNTTTTAAPTTTKPPTTTTPAMPAVIVTRIPTDEKVVALTFDAGSDRGFAKEILDVLAAHGIEASFAVTGKWAEAHSDLVSRIAAEGHTIINHTYDHPHLEDLSTAQRLGQLARGEQVLSRISGQTTKPYFRLPYGSYDQQVLRDVGAAGYPYVVGWTVDTLGWKGVAPDEIVDRCVDALRPGTIVLMHVGSLSADYSALEAVLSAFDLAGYRYATIRELLP